MKLSESEELCFAFLHLNGKSNCSALAGASKQLVDISLSAEINCFFTGGHGINADIIFIYINNIIGFAVNMNSVCFAESPEFIYGEFIFYAYPSARENNGNRKG